MTTSGTTTFNPSLGDFIINAFAKCGIRRTALLVEHMQDARFETNLLLQSWSAKGVNLWRVKQLTAIPMVAGTGSYAMPTDCEFLLDTYLSTQTAPVTDILMFGISRSDYASISYKASNGRPTSYWFERDATPTLHVWPVPSSSNTWSINGYYAGLLQDAGFYDGQNPDVVQRMFDAFTWELARRLALIYAPDRAGMLKGEAQEAWNVACAADTESVGARIIPNLSGYFR